MAPRRISPKPKQIPSKSKQKVIKFVPTYKSPTFREPRRSKGSTKSKRNTDPPPSSIHVTLSTNDERGVGAPNRKKSQNVNRQHQEIAKMIKQAVPGTVSVVLKSDKRMSKIMSNLSYHDLEMAKMIEKFRIFSGISDAQMKRGIRLIRTVQKLGKILFANGGKRRGSGGDGGDDVKKTLELLDELKDLTCSKGPEERAVCAEEAAK